MIQKLRGSNEKGFTLIELMIVIAIIGILAAIAIPNFVSYRKRSYDSAAQSDLKNLMTAQEAYFVDHETYDNFTVTTSKINTLDITPSKNVSLTAAAAGGDSYTMTAYHSSGGVTWTVNGPGGNMGKAS